MAHLPWATIENAVGPSVGVTLTDKVLSYWMPFASNSRLATIPTKATTTFVVLHSRLARRFPATHQYNRELVAFATTRFELVVAVVPAAETDSFDLDATDIDGKS